MSQISGTREYVRSAARLAELKQLAKTKGLTLLEAGEYDFQRAKQTKANNNNKESASADLP